MLGAAAAQRLGIDRLYPGERIWLGEHVVLRRRDPQPRRARPRDRQLRAHRLPGREDATSHFDGHPNTVYVRAETSQVAAVQSVLAATANPEAPNEVDVTQPSATLTAEADAQGAFNGLFLGLGAVALLVGAIGVANIMVISVLERRSEIGLRRALGATRGQIRTQFLTEAILLALIGGAVGIAPGALATAIYASHQALDDRDPHARLGGRHRRRASLIGADRRPPSRDPRRPALTHRRAADRMNAPTENDRHPFNRARATSLEKSYGTCSSLPRASRQGPRRTRFARPAGTSRMIQRCRRRERGRDARLARSRDGVRRAASSASVETRLLPGWTRPALTGFCDRQC